MFCARTLGPSHTRVQTLLCDNQPWSFNSNNKGTRRQVQVAELIWNLFSETSSFCVVLLSLTLRWPWEREKKRVETVPVSSSRVNFSSHLDGVEFGLKWNERVNSLGEEQCYSLACVTWKLTLCRPTKHEHEQKGPKRVGNSFNFVPLFPICSSKLILWFEWLSLNGT